MRHSLLALLLLAAAAGAETYVIVAGVETYDDQGISTLRYAVDDVTELADAFRGSGAKDANVTVLTSDATDRGSAPTRSNILRALQRVREKAGPEDTLIFAFSGHGMEQEGEAYLLTIESNRELLRDTALPMRMIQSILKGFRARQILFIIDACRNDPDAGKSDADASLSEGFAKDVRARVQAATVGPQPNTALLLACDVGQRAWELPEERHGSFTAYLLRGLRGAARGVDGAVRLKDLASYVEREVPAWCERANRPLQSPRLDQNEEGNFTLVPAGYTATLSSTLHIVTEPVGAKVFVKGPGDAQGRAAGKTPCEVALTPNGDNLVVLLGAGRGRQERTFRLGRGREATWVADLPAADAETALGVVELRSEPPWATIRAGDREFGRTPAYLTLPAGEQALTLELPDHEPATLTASIEAGQTLQRTVRLQPIPGHLKLVSEPAGAGVLVNGVATGEQTPCLLALSPGRYAVTLQLADHQDSKLEVTLVPRQTVEPPAVKLLRRPGRTPPPTGEILVRSDPEGAAILLGGKELGRTPAMVKLPAGEQTITLRLDGHEEAAVRVQVRADEIAQTPMTRLAVIPGQVMITTEPAGAKVLVDGRDTGEVTPCVLKLPPGQRTVRVEKKGRQSHEERIAVVAGKTLRLPPWNLPVQQRPANWPSYLRDFRPPGQMSWSSYRVSPKDGMPQVLIPAGEFTMGSTTQQIESAYQAGRKEFGDKVRRERFTAEGPQKRVYVSAFWMDLHEVTNAQYCRFLESRRPSESQRKEWVYIAGEKDSDDLEPQIEGRGGGYVPVGGREWHPVVWVTWSGAAAYAEWAGRELPTEAEWEKAARGGRAGLKYVWGDSDRPPRGAGNLPDETLKRTRSDRPVFDGYDDGYATTSPVCRFDPNPFGLYDMAGNVWEWCRDWYDGSWYGRMPDRDPQNITQGKCHTRRGGSWHAIPSLLRVAYRDGHEPFNRDFVLGFRCSGASPKAYP